MGLAIKLTIFVGITVVFLALIISLFIKVLNVRKNSKNDSDAFGEIASILEIEENEKSTSNLKDTGNNEIIAVLTAAVLAVSKSRPDYKLKVKSFRRIPQTSPIWNVAGREEQISGKL